MSYDPTESKRREMIENDVPYADLIDADKKWSTQELTAEFSVHGFLAPFVSVTRKSDGKRGTLEFTHSPRLYFNFVPDVD